MEWQEDNDSFGEFSQKTREKIKNGDFNLTEFSQNSKKALEKTSDSPMVNMVLQTSNETYNNSFCLFSRNAKVPGLKRRTNRIHDFIEKEHEKDAESTGIKDPLQIATKELDISKDTLTPQVINEEKSFDNDEEISIDNLTLTQKIIDSQTVVPYLRPRTEEEIQKRKVERRNSQHEKEIFEDTIFDDIPILTAEDDEIIEDSVFEFSAESVKKEEVESQSFEISINEKREKNYLMSDFCWCLDKSIKILWARVEKSIPFVVSWKESNPSPKIVRIKFVRYNTIVISREEAYRSYENDIRKCIKHIDKETRIPAESFLYISHITENVQFKISVKRHPKGQYIELNIPSGMSSVTFDLLFSCRESCMDLNLRRMKKCLVATLEDLNGNEISRSFIDEVRIVGYPRRDMHNYLSDAHQIQQYSMDNGVFSTLKKNNQNLLGNMNWRKRGASEMCETARNPPEQFNYQTRLLLGKSSNQLEDVEMKDQDENNEPKRLKVGAKRVIWTPVYEEDSNDLVSTGMSIANRKKYNSANPNILGPPLYVSSEISGSISIGKWLDALNLSQHVGLFHEYSILTVSDLMNHFERREMIIEKMNIPPSDCDKITGTLMFMFYKQRSCKFKCDY